MKKHAVLLLACLAAFPMLAKQTGDTTFLLTTTRSMYGLSAVELYDGYLSDLPYNGLSFNYHNDQGRYLSVDVTEVSLHDYYDVSIGATANEPQTAMISYLGFDYKWGALYNFKPLSDFKFAAGTLIGANSTFKYNNRNVNNPFNMDLACNLYLAGSVTYDVPVLGRVFRMKADVRTPVIGCFFTPMRGESYYELFSLGNYDDAFHFSSLHNKNGIEVMYLLDVPLNHTTLSFGIKASNTKYAANDMIFKQNELSLLVGLTYDTHIFSGFRQLAPSNFIKQDR